ncbi:MAG: succinate dehydrogenase, hydrophobic membrane anchor protein [Pseudomonadota bacterium]
MSSKGTPTFVIQRATAVLLIPLAAWFMIGIVSNLGAEPAVAREWIENPLNAIPLAAFVIIAAWHMRIGMGEIIIDYIHSWMKDVLLFLNWIAALGLISAAVYALYAIYFVS